MKNPLVNKDKNEPLHNAVFVEEVKTSEYMQTIERCAELSKTLLNRVDNILNYLDKNKTLNKIEMLINNELLDELELVDSAKKNVCKNPTQELFTADVLCGDVIIKVTKGANLK
jgi:hypothetical protein